VSRIGNQLARSLVEALGDSCNLAASLARVIADRPGALITTAGFSDGAPPGVAARVGEDFVQRGWLVRAPAGWRAADSGTLPEGLAAFLDGAAAMRSVVWGESRAVPVVTLPAAPSAIGQALPAAGVAHAALIPTAEAFERIADAAAASLTIMSPFLNDEGLAWALTTFERTKAPQRRLVIRAGRTVRESVRRRWDEIIDRKVEVLVYFLRSQGGEGYETFHAKVALADASLAYVGSANLLRYARHSVELGLLADGKAAQVVAAVVRAIERIATPLRL